MSTTLLKKQGKVEASDLYELAKKGLITHTGLFEVEGNPRELKGLRGENKENLENPEYLLKHGLVTVTFEGEVKGEDSKPSKEPKNKQEKTPEDGKKPGKEGGANPVVIKEEGSKEESKEENGDIPLSSQPEETSEKESKGSEK